MLCTLLLSARTADGLTLASNFIHYLVSDGYPPSREEGAGLLVLRCPPADWAVAEWSGGMSEREQAQAQDACYGMGCGYFEWRLPLRGADLARARRLRILCEASSHRADNPQTDANVFPTTLQISLNRVRVYEAVLRNHPFDSRGVLSYLRGGLGAYGYPVNAVAEGEQLQQIARSISEDALRLRCSVPAEVLAQGGLTLYGAECGRLPICPTVLIEW
jgi:hypothetical protein